jgi:AcrR family transcriptional regulator
MGEIARRAGVAPATLYRHFPAKQMLATAAYSDQVCACRAIVDEGLADPDPWRGFCLVIEKVCELHGRNRGFVARTWLPPLPSPVIRCPASQRAPSRPG